MLPGLGPAHPEIEPCHWSPDKVFQSKGEEFRSTWRLQRESMIIHRRSGGRKSTSKRADESNKISEVEHTRFPQCIPQSQLASEGRCQEHYEEYNLKSNNATGHNKQRSRRALKCLIRCISSQNWECWKWWWLNSTFKRTSERLTVLRRKSSSSTREGCCIVGPRTRT